MNPPIIALIIGLMINFSGLAPQIPSYYIETFELLGNCAIPLGLLLIGASFYALLKTDGLQTHWRIPLSRHAPTDGTFPYSLAPSSPTIPFR